MHKVFFFLFCLLCSAKVCATHSNHSSPLLRRRCLSLTVERTKWLMQHKKANEIPLMAKDIGIVNRNVFFFYSVRLFVVAPTQRHIPNHYRQLQPLTILFYVHVINCHRIFIHGINVSHLRKIAMLENKTATIKLRTPVRSDNFR